MPSNALPFETPLDSVRHMTKINKAAVKRVAILAGNDAYKCLITLVSRSCTIVLAHVVGRNNVPHEEVNRVAPLLELSCSLIIAVPLAAETRAYPRPGTR